jgi:hypothetical protein
VDRIIKKDTFNSLREHLNDHKIRAFKRDVANQWRKAHLLKTAMKSIQNFIILDGEELPDHDEEQMINSRTEKVFADYYDS